MGIFSSIKNAIFGSDEEEKKPEAAPAPAAPKGPEPISEEEMRARIAAMPNADKFNWETSIVDLMKMVGVDSSYANRKELAEELGLVDYSGTAEQNISLHHAVLNMLAAEGGNMPDMLKD
jgi:hypothetical protein